MQRIALSALQQRDAETLAGVMTALSLGAMTYAAKQAVAGKELSGSLGDERLRLVRPRWLVHGGQ